MVDVGTCNDLKEEEGFKQPWRSCHNSLHHNTPPLTPSSVPLTTLYFMYLHSWRWKGTAQSAPSLWWEGEADPCAGVIDDYGTTASGIMLAGAIYKQKHSLCFCQLQRILPFLSQTPLQGALHSGSNVIFYWESTIPHTEMARNHISCSGTHNACINILQLTDLRDCRLYCIKGRWRNRISVAP